jgi:copper chaperone NosL
VPTEPRRARWLLALAAAALGLALWRLAAPPGGPVEPAWDRVACARCHMLLSDPAFAAQLHSAGGEVVFFDDPGCLLLYRADAPDPQARAWFHDSTSDRWLSDAEVGFVPVDETPMGHGLAAVKRAENPTALGLEAALATLTRGGSVP